MTRGPPQPPRCQPPPFQAEADVGANAAAPSEVAATTTSPSLRNVAVSSNLAQTAPSVEFSPRSQLVGQPSGVHGEEFGCANLNSMVPVRSEKVHLDEIAVSPDRHRQRRSGLMSLAPG